MVEATETEDGTDVLRIIGYRPIRNCLKFSGTGRIPLRPTMNPTNSISDCAKEHFFSFTKSWCYRSR